MHDEGIDGVSSVCDGDLGGCSQAGTSALSTPYASVTRKFFQFKSSELPDGIHVTSPYANAVLSSGTNLVPELVERMTKELTVLAPFTMKLRVVAPPE